MEEGLDSFQLQEEAREKADEAMFRFRMLRELEKKKLDLDEIKILIERFENEEPIRKDNIGTEKLDIPIDDLISMVAEIFNTRPNLIKKKCRKVAVVKSRFFIFKVLFDGGWTYTEISKEFDFMDYGSIVHGRISIHRLITKKDPIYYPLWEKYIRLVNNYKPL